jgi:hypothetical protein
VFVSIISSQWLNTLEALWSALDKAGGRFHFLDQDQLRIFLKNRPEAFYFPSDDVLAVSITATEAMAEEALFNLLRDAQVPEDGMDPCAVIELGCTQYPPLRQRLEAYRDPVDFFKRAASSFYILDSGKVCVNKDGSSGHAAGAAVWECKLGKRWIPYSAHNSQQLERDLWVGALSHSVIVVCSDLGQFGGGKYKIEPSASAGHEGSWQQVNLQTAFGRPVRRRESVTDSAGGSQTAASQDEQRHRLARQPNKLFEDATLRCEIWDLQHNTHTAEGGVRKENQLFAEASLHYQNLMKTSPMAASSVHLSGFGSTSQASQGTGAPRSIWLVNNLNLERAFESKKSEIKQRSRDAGRAMQERWVFHGTERQNIESILYHGFKVGGQDVQVRNGTVYGHGVYTGIGPSAPLKYGHGHAVILALSVCGAPEQHDDGRCDAWDPPGRDWRIFREGCQLLPVFVLFFCEL